MSKQSKRRARIYIALIILQIVLLAVLFFVFDVNISLAVVIFIVELVLFVLLSLAFKNQLQEKSTGIRQYLGQTAEEAYLRGGIGLVSYDDEYLVTWMSDLFEQRGIDRVGHKVLSWLPEVSELLAGDADSVEVKLDENTYSISRKEDGQVLIFKDVTDEVFYKDKLEHEQLVLGLANFDNYEQSTEYVDETELSNINLAVRGPFNEYCDKYGILAKRINNSRYLLILDEEIFNQLMEDRFSIVNTVRRAAQNNDVVITLSLSFARGSDSFVELDTMASDMMDLAQARGGDQVAMQMVGEEVKFFGGSTEAAEKRSKVRVRVMSHAFRDLIQGSDNVIVCGHKNADFDCIGAAICVARMVEALHKPVSIIAKSGGIEEKLADAMQQNKEILEEEVNFITEAEALNQLGSRSLVVMVDHNAASQSNGQKVLESAEKVVIIDHHRRGSETNLQPVLAYIEAGASSTCEIVTEMIPYVSKNTDLSELDATFMLTGMVIDTQKWRVRCGARTYEAASSLRQMGADPQVADNYLKDTFDEFALKSLALSKSERYSNGVIIAPVENVMTRSLMSQVADSLLGIQGVNAAFVIANTEEETCISARSNGKMNVQLIMESMGGGGHLTSAALQREHCSIDDLKAELLESINTYFKEEDIDESDS